MTKTIVARRYGAPFAPWLNTVGKLGLLMATSLLLCHCTASHEPIEVVREVGSEASSGRIDDGNDGSAPLALAGNKTKASQSAANPSKPLKAFKRFAKEFVAYQRVKGIGRHGAQKAFVQLKKTADTLELVALEPFLKSPIAKATITKTTESVRWLIPKPKGATKINAMLRYLYRFYFGETFKAKSPGVFRFSQGKGQPIVEFTPTGDASCPSPGNIKVFDGKKGRLQATVITLRMTC